MLSMPILGADVLVQSLTKYYGGHSDVMSGALLLHSEPLFRRLLDTRTMMGNMPGSMEVWLLLRSIRSLHVRSYRQGESAASIANHLHACQARLHLTRVCHTSLITDPEQDRIYQKQMKGHTCIINISFDTEQLAALVPTKCRLFRYSPSLGSVESLIDYRYPNDPDYSPPTDIRLSIGLEAPTDLIHDLEQAILSSLRPSHL